MRKIHPIARMIRKRITPSLRLAGLLAALLALRAVSGVPLTPAWGPGSIEVETPEENPAATLDWRESADGTNLLRIVPRESYRRGTFALSLRSDSAAAAGQYMVLQIRLRAVAAEEGSAGQVGFSMQLFGSHPEAEKPEKLLDLPVTVGENWDTIQLSTKLTRDYPPGALTARLRPLYFSPVSEIAAWQMTTSAEPPAAGERQIYPGQQADAAWRAKAAQRINQHRRGDLAIRVLDHHGNPVPDAAVHIEQQRHFYPFGTAVVANRIADAPRHLYSEAISREESRIRNAHNAIYREKLSRLFNYAVFENDLKWPFWIEPNHWRRPEWTRQSFQWLRDRDFLIKGHTLVWGSWSQTPSWLRQYEDDPEELQRRILLHIKNMAAATRDHVHQWDVLNEPMSHRDIIEIVGIEGVAQWFRTAREAMPGVELVINDFDLIGNNGSPNRQQKFIAFVEALLAEGAPIDAIGFQSHFWSTRLTPPESIWRIIDRFAALGLDLYVTEFDMNYPDEKVQADYTRDFLTAWFSHPATNGFLMWGFYGDAHWFGEAGALFRTNWEPKPNALEYQRLLFGDWWTDRRLRTDPKGRVSTRPFFGKQAIRVEAKGFIPAKRIIDHTPGSPASLTILLSPQNQP